MSGCTRYRIVDDGEVNPRGLDALKDRTAAQRDLAFKRPVHAAVYSKAESEAFFAPPSHDGAEPVPLSPEDRVAHRLGLLPDGLRLSDVFGRALAGNAAGVYLPPSANAAQADATGEPPPAPDEGRLFIVEGILPEPLRTSVEVAGYVTGTDWANTVYLSHELIHALQDQHYGLDSLVSPHLFQTDRDRALARKAVLESEANLFAQGLLLGLDLDSFVQRRSLIGYLLLSKELDVAMARWMTPEVPTFYVRLLVEQYSLGLRYLRRLTDEDGIAGIDAAYPHLLPRSTEQLLWPSKGVGPSFDEPRLPELIAHADLSTLNEATRLGGNVFGALSFRLVLEPVVGKKAALAVAKGWGGDRYTVFDHGGRTLLVWRTVWDSPEDAQEFVDAYGALLGAKYPGRLETADGGTTGGRIRYRIAPKESAPGTPGVRTEVDEFVALVHQGDRVLVVEGADEAELDDIVDELWPLTTGVVSAPPALPARPAAPLRPQRGPEDLLRRRVFLPHHRIAARMGAGLSLYTYPGEETLMGFGLEREFRWGFREHLEYAPPLLFSLELPAPSRLQSVVTLGLSDVFFIPGPDLYLGGKLAFTEALHLHRRAALLGQVSFDSGTRVGGGIPWLDVTAATGLLLAPLDGLVLSVGAGWRQPLPLPAGEWPKPWTGDRGIILGSVHRRGSFSQPTVELRLIDELYAYEASTVFLSPVGELLEQRHVLGLLLYF